MSASRRLGALALLLGAVLASFPARNSDLWLHLANGRALAEGKHAFGEDAFAHTTAGLAWANRAWLFDLLAYETFSLLGGTALVLGKVLLIVALTAALLRLSQRRSAGTTASFVPALAVLLALVASAPWLQLRPTCVSYLFLALTLLALSRPAPQGPSGRGRGRRVFARAWPLLLLFAAWANLDDWFLLGPLTVALWWLAALARKAPPAPQERLAAAGDLTLLLIASLLVCLVSPSGAKNFALPAQLGLSEAARALRDDPIGRALVISPLEGRFYRTGAAWSPGALAFVALVLLSGASFVVNRSRLRLDWLLVWFAFLALSSYQARAIPFFAVVAAPVLGRNFQEGLADRPNWLAHLSSPVLRAAALLVGLALVVVAWPGWLQERPSGPRGWSASPDPSFGRLSERLADWRRQGELGPEDRAFNFSPEAAHYLAWFSPEEKGFLDARFDLFSASTAEDYRLVRQSLLFRAGLADSPGRDWRKALRSRQVRFLVLSDGNRERRDAVFRALLAEPEWDLLCVEGHTAVFGWRDEAPDRFARVRFDARREALRPREDRKAPAEGPASLRPRRFYDAFLPRAVSPTGDRDEAVLHLVHFEALREPEREEARRRWTCGLAGSLLGAACPGPPSIARAVRASLPLNGLTATLSLAAKEGPGNTASAGDRLAGLVALSAAAQRDEARPELLFLAIRAARRAIRDNPNDAPAHAALGEAYLRLAQQTRERGWGDRLPGLLDRLRWVQAVTALERATTLQPGLELPRLRLIVSYRQEGHLDLALGHLQALAANARQGTASRAALEKDVAILQDEVRARSKVVQVNAVNLKVPDRARLALGRGLTGQALEGLLGSDLSAFGADGMNLELELLLTVGRAGTVREWLAPEHREALGAIRYHWLRALQEAALGNYARADRELARMSEMFAEAPWSATEAVPVRLPLSLAAAQAVLGRHWPEGGPAPFGQLTWSRGGPLNQASKLVVNLRQEANLTALRGLLALECGEVEQAEGLFRRALAVWGSDRAVREGAGLHFGAVELARHWQGALASVR